MKHNPFDPYNPEEAEPTTVEKLISAAALITALYFGQLLASHLWPTLFR